MSVSVRHIPACSAVWLPLFKMSDVPLLVNTEMCVNCCNCLLLYRLLLYLLLCQQYRSTAERKFAVIQIPDDKLGTAIWKLGEKEIRMSSLHKKTSRSLVFPQK